MQHVDRILRRATRRSADETPEVNVKGAGLCRLRPVRLIRADERQRPALATASRRASQGVECRFGSWPARHSLLTKDGWKCDRDPQAGDSSGWSSLV